LTNTSSIESTIELNSLVLFPNPVRSSLNIDFNVKQNSDNIRIEILNILGSTLIQKEIGTLTENSTHRESVDVSTLPEGIYLVTINAGTSVVSRKIQVVN
jgi:hypothetical protein